jgi:hypothetical protein
MTRLSAMMAVLALLAACGDGQPFFDGTDGGTGVDPDDGDGSGGCSICGDPDLPPGTDEPSATSAIVRFEAIDDHGGGFVQDVSYNAEDDTFSVDNLAFDGANVYQRGDEIASLGGYAIYEGRERVRDSETGALIDQFTYRAIYGVSRNRVLENGERVPRSQFAIVRSGSYIDYGFGGFIYERNGSVEIPVTGQALYTGNYSGIRVFENRGGLEYTRADIEIAVDFRDFNDGNGVRGELTNRQVFDINGNRIRTGNADGELAVPVVTFVVGPGVMTDDGEISAGVVSTILNDSGALEEYESGTYYGILGGENASEIVGVIVMESADPRYEGVTAQETGGFIVYRGND